MGYTRDLLVSLRGGLPEACDFCGTKFAEGDVAHPEEAGAWACSPCVTRWRKEDAAEQQKSKGQ